MDAGLVVGTISVLPLIIGLVQYFKEMFNLEGKPAQVLSFGVAILVVLAVQLIPMLPANYGQYVELVLGTVAWALAAQGLYQVGSNFVDRATK